MLSEPSGSGRGLGPDTVVRPGYTNENDGSENDASESDANESDGDPAIGTELGPQRTSLGSHLQHCWYFVGGV